MVVPIWARKRRSNGAQFKPNNQQKCNWGQRPVTGIWTEGSIVSNIKPENNCCHESARKISTSNLQEGPSSRPSDFSEDYSSSVSYSSSASESSSALHSSEVYSSSMSDSSKFSSSSTSDSCIVYSSSNTDRSEDQDINEFKDLEEIQPLQYATSSAAQKASDNSLRIPVGPGVDSLSQIIGHVSKASLDPAECQKAVQTMHNLSVLLLVNSSFSDNLSESDLQILQFVICNISQCLLKNAGVSKSTDVAAFMPDTQLVAANSGKTEKDCCAADEKKHPLGARSSQISEVELSLIKSEFRGLKTELEMEGVKKAHAGACENGDIETLANRNDVNNGSCPQVNSDMKENDFDCTSAPFSKERNHWLPDLNLDPIMDDESCIDEFYIKKYEDHNAISQNNISDKPIQKSSLNATAHTPGQPNAEAETKQIEDHFRVLQEPRSCSDSDTEYMRDYTGYNLVEDGATTECPTKIGSPIDVHDLENVDVVFG